jgi:lipoate-protein ligase A
MPTPNWKLIIDGPLPGGYNMAVDEVLLQSLQPPPRPPATYLRFYQWQRPTLSLGFSQKASKVVNFPFCRKHCIDVVRRITGGKAVLHHQEITYAVISNDNRFFPQAGILGTYQRIAQGLQLGLEKLGVQTELATGRQVDSNGTGSGAVVSCFALSNHYEILCQGRKLVGSAQRRLPHGFLQHGSILLDCDFELWQSVLQSSDKQEGISQQVACLNEYLDTAVSTDEIIGCLTQGFGTHFRVDFEPFTFSSKLEMDIQALESDKYVKLPADLAPLGV